MIQTERMLITPAIARQMLETSKGNRGLRRAKIDAYREAMLTGEWHENGDTIRFYDDGTLNDGHHRLTACVDSGVSFYVIVVRGLSRQAAKTVDKGASRNNADELALHSNLTPDDARVASGIARHVIIHDLGFDSWAKPGGTAAKHLTAIRVSRWVDENREEVVSAIEFAKHVVRKGNTMMPKAPVAALYVMGGRINHSITHNFLEQVFLGYGVAPGGTADHLRSVLLAAAMGGRKMPQNIRLLSAAKALRSMLAGRTIKHAQNVVFRPGYDSMPQFPLNHTGNISRISA